MAEKWPDTSQRWTASTGRPGLDHREGQTSAQAAARNLDVGHGQPEEWRDRFFLGGENTLRGRADQTG